MNLEDSVLYNVVTRHMVSGLNNNIMKDVITQVKPCLLKTFEIYERLENKTTKCNVSGIDMVDKCQYVENRCS